jgi:hypothetical protein
VLEHRDSVEGCGVDPIILGKEQGGQSIAALSIVISSPELNSEYATVQVGRNQGQNERSKR